MAAEIRPALAVAFGRWLDAANAYGARAEFFPDPLDAQFLKEEDEAWLALVRARNAWLAETEKEKAA